MEYRNSLEFAKIMDEKDPLKDFRNKFFIPQHNGKDCIYFTGNSLGLQPILTAQYVQQELDDWAKMGVEGHFHAKNPWMPYHEIFPEQLSKIVGCKEHEVVVMNTLTVNLHLLMVSFYKPTKQRYKIICEAKAFPSDQYAFETQAKYHGYDPAIAVIEVSPGEGEYNLRTEDIISVINKHGESVAVVLLGGVNYYTGQYFDLKAITKAAHEVGAYAGFDLAHAAGNVELKLHEWNVDFAAWCSYKYLNSGPGSLGAIFIHDKHGQDLSIPRLSGWWGHNKETRFKMRDDFDPLPGAEGWQLSNPPILPLAAMRASLEIFDEAGIQNLRTVSKINSQRMYDALASIPHVKLITPADPDQRGCQLSLLVEQNGRQVFDHLSKAGVIADWREPNVIRIAPVPLYNTAEDIERFINILTQG